MLFAPTSNGGDMLGGEARPLGHRLRSDTPLSDAALYESPFQYLIEHVKSSARSMTASEPSIGGSWAKPPGI